MGSGEVQAKAEMIYHAYFPVDEHVVKKNNRNIFVNKKTGRMFPGKSKKLVSAENWLTMCFKSQLAKWGLSLPIQVPVKAQFVFYYPEDEFYTKQGTISRKLPDLSNLYQLPEDCLQAAGVIQNDWQIFSHTDCYRSPWDEKALLVSLYTATDTWAEGRKPNQTVGKPR